MTRFETNVYDFGEEIAIKNYCFWTIATEIFMYIGYIFTPPFRFIKHYFSTP